MKDTELVAALRQMKVNTKSGVCMGCSYKVRCSTDGCYLIGLAADRLSDYEQVVETIKAMHTAASGAGKSLLRYVLLLFDGWYGQAPEPPSMVYDFQVCFDTGNIVEALSVINNNAYEIVSVVRGRNEYIIFFRRPARE